VFAGQESVSSHGLGTSSVPPGSWTPPLPSPGAGAQSEVQRWQEATVPPLCGAAQCSPWAGCPGAARAHQTRGGCKQEPRSLPRDRRSASPGRWSFAGRAERTESEHCASARPVLRGAAASRPTGGVQRWTPPVQPPLRPEPDRPSRPATQPPARVRSERCSSGVEHGSDGRRAESGYRPGPCQIPGARAARGKEPASWPPPAGSDGSPAAPE